MSDLISRQDAIRAVMTDVRTEKTACLIHANMICKRIEDLPSAQPEIKCDSCRYNDLEWDQEPCDSCTVVGENCHYKPSAQQWIPCSDRLPETMDHVICCTITKKGLHNIVIGYFMNDRWCCGMNSNVLAWMPLPEPYRADMRDSDA